MAVFIILKNTYILFKIKQKIIQNKAWKINELRKINLKKTALKEFEKSEFYHEKQIYYYFSKLHMIKNNKAILHINNAIKLNPISKYYVIRSDYNKFYNKPFLNDLSSAINLEPQNDHYWYLRGINYYNLGQNEKAVTDFSEAIKIEPQNKLYFYLRGTVYLLINNKDLALKDWKKAEELGEKIPWNLYNQTDIQNTKSSEKSQYKEKEIIRLKDYWIKTQQNEILKHSTLLDILEKNIVNSIDYSSLLKCFEWQYKRFRIIVRDNFLCKDCDIPGNNLEVHHLYYIKDALPWEIEDSGLVSLCRKCHSNRHMKERVNVYSINNGKLIPLNNSPSICVKCNGSGYFPEYKHIENGICFLCRGNVINKTIFSKRLTDVKNDSLDYNLKNKQTEFKEFMNSISTDYYQKNINNKFELTIDSDDLPF